MERRVCNRNCWILGAIAGVVVLLFTSGIGELGFFAGLFLGLLTFGLFGAMLVWLVCNDRPELSEADEAVTGLAWHREAIAGEPEAMLVPAELPVALAAKGQRLPIVAGARTAGRPAAVPVAPVAADAADAAVGSVVRQGDDLRRIKGVGPKLSVWLNENGVSRFEQIAAWDAATIADFAARMGRMGSRIEVDDWVGQARLLAQGHQTEHSRAVDRGEAT